MPLAMTDCPDCGAYVLATSQGTCPNCGFALVECGQPPPQKDPPAQASAAASDFPPAPAGSLLNTVLTVTALFVALVVAVSGADPNRSLPAAIAMYVGLPYVVIMGIRLKSPSAVAALGTAFIWLGSGPASVRSSRSAFFFFEDLFVILMITLVYIGLGLLAWTIATLVRRSRRRRVLAAAAAPVRAEPAPPISLRSETKRFALLLLALAALVGVWMLAKFWYLGG